MIFSRESIVLTCRDRDLIGNLDRDAFSWEEFDILHKTVAEAFGVEAACELMYFDMVREECDDVDSAFNSSALPHFDTHRLGRMLVNLDRIATA